MSPTVSLSATTTTDDERGTAAVVSSYGDGKTTIVAVELAKMPAVRLSTVRGVGETTISEALGHAIANLISLAPAEAGDDVKADLRAYLAQYSETGAWLPATVTVDGTRTPAYQLDYRGGRAIVVDAGDKFLAISAPSALDGIEIESQDDHQ